MISVTKNIRLFSVFYGVICICIISATIFGGFKIHEVYNKRKLAKLYQSNHELLLRVNNDYSSLIEAYKPAQSRLYEYDFSVLTSPIDALKNSTNQSKSGIATSADDRITKQSTQLNKIFNDTNKLALAMDQYAGLITCLQNVDAELRKLDESVSSVQIITGENVGQPDLESIAKVGKYFQDRGDTVIRYNLCYQPHEAASSEQSDSIEQMETLDLVKDFNSTTDLINATSKSYLTLSSDITSLIEFIKTEQFTQAAELSKQIVESQIHLLDMAIEPKLFVPSTYITSLIDTINTNLNQYNEFNEAVSFEN